MVMENLFARRNIKVMYDLKGKFSRLLSSASKDDNIEKKFVRDARFITQSSKKTLKRALLEDTIFLHVSFSTNKHKNLFLIH